MNKIKKTDGCSLDPAAAVDEVAASSAAAWQERAMCGYSQMSMPLGPKYYASTSSYNVRPAECSLSFTEGPSDSSNAYQNRKSFANFSDKMIDGVHRSQDRHINEFTGYQATVMPGSRGSQKDAVAMSSGLQRMKRKGLIIYQGDAADEAAAYQKRLIHEKFPIEGRIVDSSSERQLYQGDRSETSTLSEMGTTYKRDRKLPSRLEDMLREQVNLDESILLDAIAVAMEDLTPEKEANLVARGRCHLCGLSKTRLLPVVNFCPHADENHSLCREHLRSVYRVRMEALFVGRNGSAPNRRLFRCLMCTRGCPCSGCTAEKAQDVQNYRRYLFDTLRCNGHGLFNSAMSDQATDAAFGATSTSAMETSIVSTSESRLTYGIAPTINGRQYGQHSPTSSPGDRRLTYQNGTFSLSAELENMQDGRRHVPIQQFGYEKNLANNFKRHEAFAATMQAQPKSPRQRPPLPKRAAKDTSSSMLVVMADSAHVSGSSRLVPPQVQQSCANSPSAATVLNCAESEKSLVQLLNSLNQGGNSVNSTERNVFNETSKDSSYRLDNSHFIANEIAVTSESSGITLSSNNAKTDTIYSGHGIAGRLRRYQDHSSPNLKHLGDGFHHDVFNVNTQSVDEALASTRTTSNNDVKDSLSSCNIKFTARDDGNVEQRDKSAVKRKETELKARSMPSLKLKGHEKGSSHTVGKKETQSLPKSLSPPSHREPRRQRKHLLPGEIAPPAKRRTPKSGPAIKRGRGRPPSRAKHGHKDDRTSKQKPRVEQDEKQDDYESGSESELDANLDFCEVCQGAGNLVCCDKCPRSYHLQCLHMTESDLPEGDWQCNECKKPSRFDAYSAAVASERNLLDKCLKVVACLKSHPFSKPFLSPVENVPLYTRVVKQPMDLSKIETKLKLGAYVSDSNRVASELDITHFANDVRLMWSNCKLFNDDGSGITRAADILSAGFERLFRESIQPH